MLDHVGASGVFIPGSALFVTENAKCHHFSPDFMPMVESTCGRML